MSIRIQAQGPSYSMSSVSQSQQYECFFLGASGNVCQCLCFCPLFMYIRARTSQYVPRPYAQWQDWGSLSSRYVLPPFDFYQSGYESSSFEWRWFPNTFRILEKWLGRKARGFLLCCLRTCLSPSGALGWCMVVIIHMHWIRSSLPFFSPLYIYFVPIPWTIFRAWTSLFWLSA